MEFEKKKRNAGVSISQFISDWENLYHKLKNDGCEMSDMVLAFKLLHAATLPEMERKLVLTGVDYVVGK